MFKQLYVYGSSIVLLFVSVSSEAYEYMLLLCSYYGHMWSSSFALLFVDTSCELSVYVFSTAVEAKRTVKFEVTQFIEKFAFY